MRGCLAGGRHGEPARAHGCRAPGAGQGHAVHVRGLLADAASAARYVDGSFACLYLAPYNYHRIHMPFDGVLRATRYVPGQLFSVNASTARTVPQLFARNERVVCDFDTDHGPMCLVLVGALFVGSIETVFAGEINPPPGRGGQVRMIEAGVGRRFRRGEESAASTWARPSSCCSAMQPRSCRVSSLASLSGWDSRSRDSAHERRAGRVTRLATHRGARDAAAARAAAGTRPRVLRGDRRPRGRDSGARARRGHGRASRIPARRRRCSRRHHGRIPPDFARIRDEAPAVRWRAGHLPGVPCVSRGRTRRTAQPRIHDGRVVSPRHRPSRVDARCRALVHALLQPIAHAGRASS